MPLEAIFPFPENLSRLNRRDPEYLESIFRDCNPRLLRMLAANRIFAETAEDLVHQTWERFFTNLDKFEGRSEISTFVCGILLNKIREHRRATGKIIFEEESETVMGNSFTPEGWWKNPPHDPSRLLENAEASAFVAECLEGLSEQQKSAFLLREVEQEEAKEICNLLSVSISNLRVLLFRAREKLRQCLEGKVSRE